MSTFTGSGAADAFAPEKAAKTAAKAPKTNRLGFTFISSFLVGVTGATLAPSD
jgi:hypothetical protein